MAAVAVVMRNLVRKTAQRLIAYLYKSWVVMAQTTILYIFELSRIAVHLYDEILNKALRNYCLFVKNGIHLFFILQASYEVRR